MSEDPNVRPAEGYEGAGLGPEDHAEHEQPVNPPDGQVGDESDLVHDGLGPRRDPDTEDAAAPGRHKAGGEDLEHDGLGPHDHPDEDAQ